MFRPDPQLPAETASHFHNVRAQLRRDIVAMRDSFEPSRYDDEQLDKASQHFDKAFAALQTAIPSLPRDPADDQ